MQVSKWLSTIVSWSDINVQRATRYKSQKVTQNSLKKKKTISGYITCNLWTKTMECIIWCHQGYSNTGEFEADARHSLVPASL